MDQIKDVNSINVQNNRRATFSNGLMQVDKIHRLVDHDRVAADLDPVAHQRLEVIFRILAIMEIMLTKVKVKVYYFHLDECNILDIFLTISLNLQPGSGNVGTVNRKVIYAPNARA